MIDLYRYSDEAERLESQITRKQEQLTFSLHVHVHMDGDVAAFSAMSVCRKITSMPRGKMRWHASIHSLLVRTKVSVGSELKLM